jgi:hypothetical protein
MIASTCFKQVMEGISERCTAEKRMRLITRLLIFHYSQTHSGFEQVVGEQTWVSGEGLDKS